MDEHEATVLRASLRTPRAAGIAGIVFSLLLASVLLLIRFAVPSGGSNGEGWLIARDRQPSVVVALNLVPFAGIAFLWFIGVIRDNVGDREDRFFATVFLGSGLLFVAMLFVGAAIAGGLLADSSIRLDRLPLPNCGLFSDGSRSRSSTSTRSGWALSSSCQRR